MVLVRVVAALFGAQHSPGLYLTFHGGVARLFNIRITTTGTLHTAPPTLYVSNHVSYLDVFVLGAWLPGSFIAKSEVSGWPVFGKLAKLQNTLFFERNVRRAADQIAIMREHLANGKSLIFFPEGTSTPGTHVEPFRSSLFQAAEGEDTVIQPVSVAYTAYDGEPMTQAERDYYAWYLPMTFLPHFLNALGLRRAEVELVFHEPVRVADFESRKACAAHCEHVVRDGLQRALEGA